MATESFKLTAESEPRILGEELVKNYATVTRDAITINITSCEHIHRTIYYTEKGKFDGWEDQSVHECGNDPFVVTLNENQRGSEFIFRVLAREKHHGLVTENFQFTVRAELTKAEMQSFLNNILDRVEKIMQPAFLYRNLTKDDVKRIMESNSGCFEMNLKLRSGHRSSPLYRKLDNVTYFSCKLFTLSSYSQLSYLPEGFRLPHFSPFGDERAAYEACKLFSDQSVLFLGGMHCYGSGMQRAHYITVVVCLSGSLSYLTCIELGLIELDWKTNPILQWDKSTGELKCATKLKRERAQCGPGIYPHDVWVEIILCDKAVALSDGHLSTCEHRVYSSDHRSATQCESCHEYSSASEQTEKMKELSVKSPLKRKSLENSAVPEKVSHLGQKFTMISPPVSPFKPPGARDLRVVRADDFIEHKSLSSIVTRLRSTEYVKTRVSITETKRFGNEEVVNHGEEECEADPFVLLVKPEMYGSKLTFTVTQIDVKSNVISDYFQFDVHAVFTREELAEFIKNIESRMHPSSMRPARFYRNHDPEDEKRCMEDNNGCFEHMRKLRSGHRASPLFHQLNATYMSCKLEIEEISQKKITDDGIPKGFYYPDSCHFGTIRRSYDVKHILNKNSCLFLAGMHCYIGKLAQEWHNRAHYISVVVCQKGTATYYACIRMGLKQLDWATNNILRWNQETDELFCATQLHKLDDQMYGHSVWPEIMLADTSVRIEDGLKTTCIKQKSSGLHKSFLGCKACHGYRNVAIPDASNEHKEETRKRVSDTQYESDYHSPEKIRLMQAKNAV